MGSYPYLIHSQHRTGFAHHFSDGSRTTALVRLGEETIDLCTCPTRFERVSQDSDGATVVQLSPATLEFSSAAAHLTTTYRFERGGRIHISRRIAMPDQPEARFFVTEYVKASYGFTEYPLDLHGVVLSLDGATPAMLEFAYRSRSRQSVGATRATADVPQIGASLTLETAQSALRGAVTEGFLFNPYYTLSLEFTVGCEEEVVTCLTVKQL